MKILIKNQDSKQWEPVDSLNYNAEHELQKLLAGSPSLISISEIRESSSPLLVGVREVGLPGSGSTDILAFNESGDIAIIECKLAQNAEIKRKVIAQVLEYAAYLWGMPYDEINDLIFAREKKPLVELIREKLGNTEWDEEAFRESLQETLNKGSFIIMVAVDSVNEELLRTSRFLNNCGNPAYDFTILEIRRYAKEETEILVPHLIITSGSSKQKSTTGRKKWESQSFFDVATKNVDSRIVEIMRDLYDWGQTKAHNIWFGTGIEKGSFTFHYIADDRIASVFSVYTNGDLSLNYGQLAQVIEGELLNGFHKSLVNLPGFKNVKSDFSKFPSVKIEKAFPNRDDLEKFKQIVEELGTKLNL